MAGTLEARLGAIRKSSAERIPAEMKAVMQNATAALQSSGQIERALSVGDRMTEFSLPDSTGRVRSSQEFLDRGTLVLSFFRGHW